MVGHRVVVLGLVALLVVPTGGSMATPADGTAPTLSLSIDSTTIEDGDEYGTAEDPDLDIEASVGENASAEAALAEVVVRLNGDRYRNFSTTGDGFSKTVPLDVDNGENTVRVIVSDTGGRATSITFTVLKDDRRPVVYLTAPYQSIPYDPIGDGRTNGSWSWFNATVIDDSNATTGTMTIWWNDSNDALKKSVSISDIGSDFSKRVFLGHGTNRVRLAVNDEYGNTRIDDFDVRVADSQPPRVTLGSHPERINQSALLVSGTITDDVWIDKAQILAEQTDGDERIKKKIRKSKNYDVDPARTTAEFERTLHLLKPGTYRVRVIARDKTGTWTNRSFRVERVEESQRSVVPEISVDRDRTAVVGPETLFLAGRAFDGQIRRVVVETRDARTGQSVGYHPVFRGSNQASVTIERNVTIQPTRTEVIVRVTDAEGGEHDETFFVDGGTGETFVGNGSGTDATETETETETEVPDGVTTTVTETTGESTHGVTTTAQESDRQRVTTTGRETTTRTERTPGRTETGTPGGQTTGTPPSTPTDSSLPEMELVVGFVALLAVVGAALLLVVYSS